MNSSWVMAHVEHAMVAEHHGAVTLLHICGHMTAVLESMADTGVHILELDHKVSLKTASERVGSRVCLMENLDPVKDQ